ncbi:sugar phosphate isomerase/epimerase family protein [Arenibacterium sp. CAU 1754]
MRPISLAHLTFLNLSPPELIHLAADAGFASVGLRLIAVTPTTPGYPLMDDPHMMRETLAAMRATGVSVNDIEFVRLTPAFDASAMDPFLSAGAELGAKYIVTAPYDLDLDRLADNLAQFAERAARFNMSPVLEFFPWTNVPDLNSALNVVARTQDPHIGVLLDTLHFDRSASRLSDIAKADPSRLPFIHLCDAMVMPQYSEEALLHTAREARLIPGQGQIRLGAILAQLPPDIQIALEIPLVNVAENQSQIEFAKKMLATTRALLAKNPSN